MLVFFKKREEGGGTKNVSIQTEGDGKKVTNNILLKEKGNKRRKEKQQQGNCLNLYYLVRSKAKLTTSHTKYNDFKTVLIKRPTQHKLPQSSEMAKQSLRSAAGVLSFHSTVIPLR